LGHRALFNPAHIRARSQDERMNGEAGTPKGGAKKLGILDERRHRGWLNRTRQSIAYANL
jgi:hypothetical protein